MTESTIREELHRRLLEASAFYRASTPEHQQTYLDDIIEEFLTGHADELISQGLGLLDSMQRVDSGRGKEGSDDGWSW